MKIKNFNGSKSISGNSSKLSKSNSRLNSLIEAANQHELPNDLVIEVNQKIDELMLTSGEPDALARIIEKNIALFLGLLKDKAQLFPKDYFRNLWMGIGMAVFGIPFGIALSTALKNYAFISTGLPIGLSIGIAIGISKDNQIKKEGRQLDF